MLKAEYQLWQSKWNLVESRPSTAIEALHQCDQLMYPNMYELLKILSILPVSTATAERIITIFFVTDQPPLLPTKIPRYAILHYHQEKVTRIINACTVLHNMCITNNVPLPTNEHVADIDMGIIQQNIPNNEMPHVGNANDLVQGR
ncbi:52 kDa repressor of the inhibitor of the protein kinase-like [Aphis craccivora]|uniref:52 kDa repressor of the inhibitor of the protein kinase-like n=1 Tax=Aphis craccivora TaxID=307492 RepID=A0A6G0YYI7_APHCR|nr:52 kDa repressor of the inhibitor of the protein kinase-like [Aphis craccivora]